MNVYTPLVLNDIYHDHDIIQPLFGEEESHKSLDPSKDHSSAQLRMAHFYTSTQLASDQDDDGPSTAILVCNRKLTVTWTQDVVAFRYPKTDSGEEQMQITGANSYTKGVAKEVGATEPFLIW